MLVRVQVIGKGVAQPGAKLLSHGADSTPKPSKRQCKEGDPEGASNPINDFAQTGPVQGHGSQAVPVKDSTTDLSTFDMALHGTNSTFSGAAATAAAAASQSVFDANELELPSDTEGASDTRKHCDSEMHTVMGVVTSGVTRGVSSNSAALALCSLAALQQAQKTQQQALSKYSLGSVSGAMQMQSPASTAVRNVVVRLQYNFVQAFDVEVLP